MKTAKKVVIYGICALLIATTSIIGTLAYLTDTEEAVNTFTVGKVDIVLNETDTDANGVAIAGAARVTENKYHMIPGQKYVKDPTITVVNGSAEAYVRMIVEINCYDVLQQIFNGGFLPQYFVEGWDNTTWLTTNEIKVSTDGKTATYEFRYKEPVNASGADVVLAPLFEKFVVPAEFDGTDLQNLQTLKIRVIGHAIQTGSFEANGSTSAEDAAWAAFDAQMASTNP